MSGGPMLVDAGPLGLRLCGAVEHAGEDVLDLRHVGHDVLDQDEGDGVVDLALALLPQDLLVAPEKMCELVSITGQNHNYT